MPVGKKRSSHGPVSRMHRAFPRRPAATTAGGAVLSGHSRDGCRQSLRCETEVVQPALRDIALKVTTIKLTNIRELAEGVYGNSRE